MGFEDSYFSINGEGSFHASAVNYIGVGAFGVAYGQQSLAFAFTANTIESVYWNGSQFLGFNHPGEGIFCRSCMFNFDTVNNIPINAAFATIGSAGALGLWEGYGVGP